MQPEVNIVYRHSSSMILSRRLVYTEIFSVIWSRLLRNKFFDISVEGDVYSTYRVYILWFSDVRSLKNKSSLRYGHQYLQKCGLKVFGWKSEMCYCFTLIHKFWERNFKLWPAYSGVHAILRLCVLCLA